VKHNSATHVLRSRCH